MSTVISINNISTTFTLNCPVCNKKLNFSKKTIKNENFYLENAPILECSCSKVFSSPIFKEHYDLIIEIVSENQPLSSRFMLPFEKCFSTFKKKYQVTNPLKFKFDEYDYYFIPGLYRTHNRGFLTPLYFNKEVLLKYLHHPLYKFSFNSGSYFSIELPDDIISIGVNPNGKVIMWLGDVLKLPKNEQFYLLSENIDSDHDIYSEFYDAQILCEWASESIEANCINNFFNISNLFTKKYNSDFSQHKNEVFKLASTLNKPLLNREKEFYDTILILNQLFIESININSIKNFLNQFLSDKDKKELNKLKSAKTLEIFLQKKLNVSEEEAKSITCPLFVLNDLRQISGHLLPQKREDELFISSLNRLNISSNKSFDFISIYETLIISINSSFEKIIDLIKKN